MRYGKQQQGVLAFEPPPRIRLPEAARQEAVAVLAAVQEDRNRAEPDGGNDE